MSSQPPRPLSFFSLLAALASTVPWIRPSQPTPAGAPPFVGSPPPDAPGGHPRRGVDLRKSLRAANLEGMVAEVITACVGGAMITAWGMHLGCSPALIGVLNSLNFMSQFVQFPAAWLTSTFGHRRMCISIVAISRFSLLGLALLPLLPLSLHGKQVTLAVVSAVYAVLSVAGNNAWIAWMGDLVPSSIRGRYFGRRTALCTLGGTLAAVAAGVLLDRARALQLEAAGLALLAVMAVVSGAICLWLMLQQDDPGHERSATFDLSLALKPFRDHSARRLLAYQAFWNVGLGFSAGYFTLHSVQNLGMGFTLMALHTAAMSVVRILAAPVWGRIIDRVGARPVLLFCSFGMSCIPLIWLFPRPDNLWPLVVDVFWTGLVWSGHAVAAFHLPLSVAPRKDRAWYLAAFATVGGLFYAASSALGGTLLVAMPRTFELGGFSWFNVHLVFVISASLRIVASAMSSRIVEPGAASVRELRGVVADEVGELRAKVVAIPVAVVRRISSPENRSVG